MPSFNQCVFAGNLTRDPEIRYVDSGKAVTKFSIAINRKTNDRDEVMYLDIVAWERLGEIANQYLKKGSPVLISGRLSIRDYDDKDGNKRKAIECVAGQLQFLGTKDSGNGSQSNDGGQSRSQSSGSQSQGRDQQRGRGNSNNDNFDGFGDAFDEEIPF